MSGALPTGRAGGADAPEPLAASQPEALIPSADELTPPTSADVYRRTIPAAKVVAETVGCDIERALEILRELVEAGYFIAPRIPTDPMLYAYFSAYGQQAWSPRTIIQNIGKARMRWQAMGQAGTAMAFSRKFLREPASVIEAAAAGETAKTGSTEGESAVPQGDAHVGTAGKGEAEG